MRNISLETNPISRSPSPSSSSNLNPIPQNPMIGNYSTNGTTGYNMNQRMVYQSPTHIKPIYSPLNGGNNSGVISPNNTSPNMNPIYQTKKITSPSVNFNYNQYQNPNFYGQKNSNLSVPGQTNFDKSRQIQMMSNNVGRLGNNSNPNIGNYYLSSLPRSPNSSPIPLQHQQKPNIIFSNSNSNGGGVVGGNISNYQSKSNSPLISNSTNTHGVKYVFPSMYQSRHHHQHHPFQSNTPPPGSFNSIYQNVSYSPSRSPSPTPPITSTHHPLSPNSYSITNATSNKVGSMNNNSTTISIGNTTTSPSLQLNYLSTNNSNNMNGGIGNNVTKQQKIKKTSNEQMKKSIAIQRLEEFSSLENKIFSKLILTRDDEEYYREIISPYSLKKLNSFIRRDFKLKTKQNLILNELFKFHYNYDQSNEISIDFCYLKKYHLEQVNHLIRRFYWNSIDVKDYLLCPENTVIVLYKRLVIGCGFIKNGYIPFLVSMPNWSGIEKYILYFLMKSSFRDGKVFKFLLLFFFNFSFQRILLSFNGE